MAGGSRYCCAEKLSNKLSSDCIYTISCFRSLKRHVKIWEENILLHQKKIGKSREKLNRLPCLVWHAMTSKKFRSVELLGRMRPRSAKINVLWAVGIGAGWMKQTYLVVCQRAEQQQRWLKSAAVLPAFFSSILPPQPIHWWWKGLWVWLVLRRHKGGRQRVR